MIKKYLTHDYESDKMSIHYEGPINDYSLCGNAMEADLHACKKGYPKITTKKVDCKICLLFIEHVIEIINE